jgi:hypothetical protein
MQLYYLDKRRIVQVADSKTVTLGQVVNEVEPDKEQNDVTIAEPTQPRVDTPTGMVIDVFKVHKT